MYKKFFGLQENPFNINPDPRYLFLTPQTQKALDQLTYGIQARQGLILLTGEVGTGKTTVINRLRDWLHQQQTPTAFIFNSHLETGHLFDCMLADFKVPPVPELNGTALMRLNQWLFSRYRAGELPVLIVDEAQGLQMHVLEEIRMLLNLETPHEKLLQIVLAGQPELEAKLNRPELRQLKQRITFRCKTGPLTLQDAHDYIESRLNIAGARGKRLFTSQAVESVHFYSRGIPRIMNLLCEHALINAYVEGVHLVPPHMIEEIAHEFQFDDKPLSPSGFSTAGSPEFIAEGSAFPIALTLTSEEAASYVADEPGAVGALAPPTLVHADVTTEMLGPHGAASRGSRALSLPSPSRKVTSSASIRAFTLLDSSQGANRFSDMNIASGRRLLDELATVQTSSARAPGTGPAARKKKYVWRRASYHTWTRVFDKREVNQFAIDIRTRVAYSSQRLSGVLLRPTIDWCRLIWRDEARVLHRTARTLVPRIRRFLTERYDETPRAHNSPATSIAASVFSLQSHEWQMWRDRCLSVAAVAGPLRVGKTLLRWLREPMRPFRLRQSSRG
jgi:general secretion pathway protein A